MKVKDFSKKDNDVYGFTYDTMTIDEMNRIMNKLLTEQMERRNRSYNDSFTTNAIPFWDSDSLTEEI